MPIYTYRAKDPEGGMKTGEVEASSEQAASEILHGHKFTVLDLRPKSEEGQLDRYLSFLPFFGRVSRKELVLFSRQFATLINARVPIIQGLEILAEQTQSRKLKEVVENVIAEIEGGKSLSQAIARYPKIFSNLYLNLVKSGELSGTLDQALNYLADQQEKDYDLNAKIRGAMTYPIFIVSAIIVVGGLMFIFVLPQMISVLREAGANLPFTTKILIFLTENLQKFWAVLVLGFVAAVAGLRFYIRTPGGRRVWDIFKLKVPVFGKLFRRIYMDRFCRNLSTLVAGGIPIVQALNTVAAIVGNVVYRDIILQAAAEVETGKNIAGAFNRQKEVPKMVTQMIKIGEQTGELDDILAKLARFYDKEVENSLSTLTTLLEPIIMLLLGGAVAVMVAGILLPVYNLASIQ